MNRFLILSSGRIIAAPCDSHASKESGQVLHPPHQPFPHSTPAVCDVGTREQEL